MRTRKRKKEIKTSGTKDVAMKITLKRVELLFAEKERLGINDTVLASEMGVFRSYITRLRISKKYERVTAATLLAFEFALANLKKKSL